MARPRADGTPARGVNKHKLTDLFVTSRKGGKRDELIWDVKQPGLADARRLTARIMLDVIEGKDPAAERWAERATGTVADLASQYVELYAKKHNKLEAGRAPRAASPAAALGQATSAP